jgi:predicted RNA binding protein YcfA (HicA-like mRNA interferase family)
MSIPKVSAVAPVSSSIRPAAVAATAPSTFLEEIRSRDPTVPADFFTPAEEKLLKTLFNSYHLSSRLCLIDIIGFDFSEHLYSLMEEVKTLRPNDPDIDNLELPDIFCGNFLALYLRLIRNTQAHQLTPVPQAAIDRFSLPPATAQSSIEFVLKSAGEVLAQGMKTGLVLSAQSRYPEVKKKFIGEHYRAGLGHLRHLQDLAAVFTKIVNSPYCQRLLLDQNLLCFEEGSQLSQPTPEAKGKQARLVQVPAVKHIQRYMSFLSRCLNAIEKMSMGGINIKYFGAQRQLLETQKTVTPTLVKKWNSNLHEILEPLIDLNREVMIDRQRILDNRLTHQQWLEREGKPVVNLKSQEEFLESHQITSFLCQLVGVWMEDIDSMAETHLFVPQVKEYRSKEDMESYFFKALNGLMNHPPRFRIQAATHPFKQLLASFEDQIDEACAPLRKFLSDPFLSLYLQQTKGAVTYTRLLQLLPYLKPGCSIARDLLQQLPKIQKGFQEQLDRFLALVPDVVLEEQGDRWKKDLNATFLEEFKAINGLILYFKDIEILLEKKDFLSEWDYDIPVELKRFISLDNLLKLFNRAKVEEHPATVAPLTPPEPVVEAVEEKPASPTLTVAEVQQAAVAPKADLLIAELKSAKKRKDYVSILEEWDFTHVRTKGSHEIYEGPNGGIVVLPFHGAGSLKEGTKNSVIKQAVQALDDDN